MQGVINVNFAKNAETLPIMSEEEIEAHIMEVMLIDHFNIEKGISIFGEKAETAVMEELQKIHDMNTYKPMIPSMLIYQEIKKRLVFASIHHR